MQGGGESKRMNNGQGVGPIAYIHQQDLDHPYINIMACDTFNIYSPAPQRRPPSLFWFVRPYSLSLRNFA